MPPWFDGDTVQPRAERLARQRRTARLLADVARAVHHAHQHGVLHRDLKPANILIDTRGDPHVTDFGIAKLLAGAGDVTQTLAVLGTPNYMAPEQAAGGAKQLTTAADVFSLGAILYQLLSGRLPFQGATPLETLRRVIHEQPAPLRTVDRTLHRDLATICEKCLEKDPGRRYGSAEALAEDLEGWLAGEPIAARPVGQTERLWRWCLRKPLLAVLSAGLATTILVGVIVSNAQWRRAERNASALEENLYASDMAVAYQAWETGKVARARELLDRQRPRPGTRDLRTFEWRYLFGLTRPRERLTLRGASAELWGSAISPDGRLLAAGGGDGVIQVWDFHTGAATATHRASGSLIYSVAFSPDGALLAATVLDAPEVHLWDVASRTLVARLGGHRGGVTSVAFGPDGRTVASMSGYPYATDVPSELFLWDVASRRRTAVLAGHRSSTGFLSFSPDGRTLATPQGDGTVILWDVASRAMAGVLDGHQGLVLCARFSPDGTLLSTGGVDGSVRLWDRATRRMAAVLGFHQGGVYSVAFSPMGDRLVSGSLDHTAKLWDTRSGRLLTTFKGHVSRVFSIGYAPDGSRVTTASLDGTVKVWDPSVASDSEVFDRHPGHFARLSFSRDGRLLVRAAPSGNEVTLWDTRSWEKLAVIPHAEAGFGPDGTRLATISAAKVLTFWTLASGAPRLERTVDLPAPASDGPVFSPEGRHLAVATAGSHPAVHIWDVATKREIRALRDPQESGELGAYGFSPDGRLFVTGYGTGGIRLWDAHTWSPLMLLDGHSRKVDAMAFSPGGGYLATGSADTTVRLWTTDFESDAAILKGNVGAVRAIAFSPDGQTLAVGSFDGVVTFWNVRTRREVATLEGHGSIVCAIAFSPDGRTLVTASVDETMRLWRAPALAEIDRGLHAPSSHPHRPDVARGPASSIR